MRYAIYFTPGPDDPLTRTASAWLGRDAFTGEALPAQAAGDLPPREVSLHTAPARRYGFHATLKAPFLLAPGETEASLLGAFAAFCATAEPVLIARLVIGELDGFLALVPERRDPDLDRFAADVVSRFDRFRAPLTEADIERRCPDSMNSAQLKNLFRWGYPHVFESFRFHMTLTGRVPANQRERVRAAIEETFAPCLVEPLEIASLALFAEPSAGAPFHVRSFRPLGRMQERKSA